MIKLTGVVLDVLKPHQPGALEFANSIAQCCEGLVVNLVVVEMDEKTHSLSIEITGSDIPLDNIESVINDMGGSVHSLDEVQVVNDNSD
ncbi:MAG: DUF211 domain-containing protein [Reinekea sp.]|nr:DUF211 domain-containing protein [Reinekea sp.]